MMLLLQPFVFLNPIRLDCLTIVNKSCHSATISWLPRGKGKCGVPSKANKKQHCTWKWRQLLFTTAITFNYNRLQKKVVGLQRSPIAGSTIIYSSYNYQKSKTKQTKNLAFNRRGKKNSMPTVKSIASYKGLANYAPERKLNIPRPTSAILSREEGLAFSSSPVLSEESGVSCPELGGKVEWRVGPPRGERREPGKDRTQWPHPHSTRCRNVQHHPHPHQHRHN